MLPTILITRSEEDGLMFGDQLRTRLGCGIPIVYSPVLKIEYCGHLPDMNRITHLIFTSRHGVNAYRLLENSRAFQCYTVGDATAKAAREAGLKPFSAGGTADDLVDKMLQDNIKGPCLHLRGEHSIGAIASRLTGAGISTQEAILYRQKAEPLSKTAIELLHNNSPVILPIFSPRSARLLFSMVQPTAPVWVVAISKSVANEVPETGSRRVFVAEKPNAASVLDAITAVIANGKSLEGGNPAQ